MEKIGNDISIARRKRSLTVEAMAERVGVHRLTYAKVERGDPSAAFAVYAMALFVLQLDDTLKALADPSRDRIGLRYDPDYLPRRIRSTKKAV